MGLRRKWPRSGERCLIGHGHVQRAQRKLGDVRRALARRHGLVVRFPHQAVGGNSLDEATGCGQLGPELGE